MPTKRHNPKLAAQSFRLFVPRAERLEDRATPATFTVSSTADDGIGSLRQAIVDANAAQGADVIRFQGVSGTINLDSRLLVSDGVDIQGPGAASLIISGQDQTRVFETYGGAPIRIAGLTVADGFAAGSGSGGGVENLGTLVLDGVVVRDSTAGYGGGIYNTGTLSLANTTVQGNAAAFEGGGIYNTGTLLASSTTVRENSATNGGGGISHKPDATGAITVTNSALTVTNSALLSNVTGGSGGGTEIRNPVGRELFTNVTVAFNSAGGYGGGLYSDDGSGLVRVVNATIIRNSAGQGGGIATDDGDIRFSNSIIAGNDSNGPNDVLEAFSDGGNVIGQADPASAALFQVSDVTGVTDPLLGPLGDNGGPTATFFPLAGSLAIGRGLPGGSTPANDQRGRQRPSAGFIDAGAFQAQRPTSNPDAFTVTGRTLTVSAPGFLANDTNNDVYGPLRAFFLDSLSPRAAGTLTREQDGGFTFTPAQGFAGSATFRYLVTDGVTFSQPVTVTLTVEPRTQLYAFGAGAGGGPHVKVFNTDGSLRFEFFAFDPGFNGGVRVAVGDVTGDRVDDVVVAAGPNGGPHVKVYDGLTGGELRSFSAFDSRFTGGVHLAVSDVDGDGIADVVTGAGSSGGPHVKVFAGVSGAETASFFAYNESFTGGVRVAAGDLDGDGKAEVVTAAGPSGGPHVKTYTGAGDMLAEFFAFNPDYRGGVFVSVGYTPGGGTRIFVTPDSSPDYTGTLLGDQFSTLPDTGGRTPGGPATDARLVRQPSIFQFNLGADGRTLPSSGVELAVGPATATRGTRTAAGLFRNTYGVFIGSGPSGGGRARFYPFLNTGDALANDSVLDLEVFGSEFQGSVYVGAGIVPLVPAVV